MLDEIRLDLRYGLRIFRKRPAFAAAAVLTLALGLGVNTAVFSVVNAIVFRPLPVRDSDRLVVLASTRSGSPELRGLSAADLQDYRQATRDVVEDIAGYTVGFAGLAPEGGRAERVLVTWITGHYFQLLDVRPAAGRLVRPDEAFPEPPANVAVLGFSTWQRRFDGDASVIGRRAVIDGRPYTIVGVAPRGFHGTFAFSDSEVYIPGNLDTRADRDSRALHAIAWLRPGVGLERAQSTFDVVAARLGQAYPDSNRGIGVRLVRERFARPEEDNARSNAVGAGLMLALVSLVLLIAALNVTNLLLARGLDRRRELAIRMAIGGSPGRIVRQLTTECLLIVAGGATVGIWLGTLLSRGVAAIRLPGDLPARLDFGLDHRVLMYSFAAAALTALVVGALPARRAARTELDQAFRAAGQPNTGGRRAGNALVVAQLAVCFVLLTAAAVLAGLLVRAGSVELGFEPGHVLNVHMNVAPLARPEPDGRALFDDLQRIVRQLPGVENASFAATVPMGYVRMNSRVYAEGRPAADRQRSISGQNFVDGAYFATMGMALAEGRAFSDQDRAESRPVAIVNVRLAMSLWPGERAIGKRLSTTGPDGPWAEVVGVASTGKYHLLFENPQPHVYFPIAQRYSEFRTLHVKTSLEPEALAQSVLRALQTREPDLQVFDVQSMNRALGSGYGLFVTRVAAASGATFAALALALALVGLHGLLAYRTNLRVVEVGIRMALGARRTTVLWLITRDGLRLLAWGAALGAPAALACSRLLASQVPGVTAWDALWVVPAAASLVATGAIAALVPALRASRTSPVEALRCE